MISMQEFMEVVEYRVTEGSDYTWHCFPADAKPYSLSAWNGDHEGWSFNITFDTVNQTVFIVEACDYKNNRAYRLINPDHKTAYEEYAKKHNSEHANQAWDSVDFVDLEEDDDWIQKALAIREGTPYDTRVSVPIDLDKDSMFLLMQMAHERDITLNQHIEEILRTTLGLK
jgi:hypothetical protein